VEQVKGRPKVREAPIQEGLRSRDYSYGPEFFSSSRPYFEALKSTNAQLDRVRSHIDKAARHRFNILLVHECEMAKLWQRLWDEKDDPQRATHEWIKTSRTTMQTVTRFAKVLKNLDGRQGYDLRNIFYRSAQIAISPVHESVAVMPDPNLPEGGFEVPTGGRVTQAVELQLLARLFIVRFDDWVQALLSELSELHEGFQVGRRIGPAWFEPPLTDNAISQRGSRQLAILALVARLRKALGLALRPDTPLPSNDSLAGELTSDHSPPWSLIHQFVQATFPDDANTPDLHALEQRWSSATKGRSIRLSNWPDAVVRQA
jgi:hypothetical protein